MLLILMQLRKQVFRYPTFLPMVQWLLVSFAIAMLLEICHHIGAHNDAVHQGRWGTNPDWCFWDSPLIELAQKTIGIIGFGRIGQTTGRIAKALGMNVLAYDSHPNDVWQRNLTSSMENKF